jgi:hypothetical protein
MAPLISTIEVARPPHEVYAYVTDPMRFMQWQRDVVGVRMLDESRFATTRRIAGVEHTTIQRVTRDEPPHRWACEGVESPIRPHATITVEPVSDGTGSRVTFTLDFEADALGVTLMPLIRRQAEKKAPVSYRLLATLLDARG